MNERLGQSRTPNLTEVIRVAMAAAVNDLFVCLPGKVTKYDPARQVADVLPLIKRPYVNEDGSTGLDDLPVIPDVRVMFLRGGGYFATVPLEAGDSVLLVMADCSIDEWMFSSGGAAVDPGDLRRHDLSDAFAVPGAWPMTKPIKDVVASGACMGKEGGVQARFSGGAVEITSGGLPASVGGYVALAAKVDLLLTSLWIACNTFIAGPPDGGAALATAITLALGGPGGPAPTASTNLKAD